MTSARRLRIFAIPDSTALKTAFVVIAVVLFLSYYFLYKETFHSLNRTQLDLFLRLRGPMAVGRDIVIVGVDRRTLQTLRVKAVERRHFAGAIQNLTTAGADLIAIDYLFAIPDSDPSQDEALSTAMEQSANVILASDISERSGAVPLDSFRAQEVGEGFINIFPDTDGTVREVPPLRLQIGDDGEQLLDVPFSLQTALLRLHPDGNVALNLSTRGVVAVGDLRMPLAGNRSKSGFLINYSGPSETFPALSFVDILRGNFRAEDVQGKIVLIGSKNPFHHDYYKVPFPQPVSRQKIGDAEIDRELMQSMYGVEIHANAVRMFLDKHFIAPVSFSASAVTLLVMALLATAVVLLSKRSIFIVASAVIALLAAFWLACFWLFVNGLFFPPSAVLFAVGSIALTGIVSRAAAEAAERRYITRLFGRYVAPAVVEELIEKRNLLELRGRKQRLSMFFSDIRGFTSMSEKLDPEQVSSLLNEYFSHMTRIVFKYGGTLDKFMGDAIMAFFGNPIYFADHAERAVDMALEMKEEMARLKSHWAAQGKEHSFDIGMGINTGEVVVGNLGSEEFFDYTVIGDEVNLACRLESIARRGQILISETTLQELHDKFEVITLEPVIVKGKAQPVQIYEVVKRKSAHD